MGINSDIPEKPAVLAHIFIFLDGFSAIKWVGICFYIINKQYSEYIYKKILGDAINRGGTLTKCINDLETSGFLSKTYRWDFMTGKLCNRIKYRLSDNYMRFYAYYIKPNFEKINQGDFISALDVKNWFAILGLQFENLVLANRATVKSLLNISTSETLFDSGYYQPKTKRQQGCQVDYLIQTKHNTLYVCEVKFSKYALGTSVITEVKDKIARLKTPKSFLVRPVLIHVNGVTEGVEMQDYFAKIFDFSELLER